ncbi:MAG: kynureninase [Saprospiraceae bacterium]|nr:kynureninase [Bacteroidia bacterium]MBT8229911.1 kynureninase [Bacteroidia bacterium]NNF22429.1 kynureninase [Saprospiraceae bacterium]
MEQTIESRSYARKMDQQDSLRSFRDRFNLPTRKNGEPFIYLCGNSLGLQPKKANDYVQEEMEDWARLGVEGHVHARHPWMPYHEFLTSSMANVVGGKNIEVVVMNSLTVNLHLLMVSFYRPNPSRYKILVEYSPFPSDRYAVESQARFHGYDPKEAIIELHPDENEYVSFENIQRTLDEQGDQIALVMIGGVNYYSGQLYDLKSISDLARSKGCIVGFDLAHAAGNIDLKLHDDGPDFAAWCSYKYLNSGPGSLSGVFVHERHAHNKDIPRFHGWWGHNKDIRFKMGPVFDPLPGAEAWQLSNPPILPMAAMRASLELFDEAGMDRLRIKSLALTQYMIDLLEKLDHPKIKIITPKNQDERGCQLSLQIKDADKSMFDYITEKGVIADWREPDVIRIATVPLYNSFEDIYDFYCLLKAAL